MVSEASIRPITAAAMLATAALASTTSFSYSIATVPGHTAVNKVARMPATHNEVVRWMGEGLEDSPSSTTGIKNFVSTNYVGLFQNPTLSELNSFWLSGYDFLTTGTLNALIDWNAQLSADLIGFKRLKDGWDGPDSLAPTALAVDNALILLNLLPVTAALPDVSAASDGEVNFSWRTASGYVDMGLYGTNELSFYARVGAQGQPIKGRINITTATALPRDLVTAINIIAVA